MLRHVIDTAINPAMAMLPERMESPRARVMSLAIGLQESRFEHTHQIGGPAHGWWQFERGGGVRGVLNHAASRGYARELCLAQGVPAEVGPAFDAIEHDQVLAAGFARLLLWTDPKALPALGDVNGAWDLYIRTWRPGKPHPETWPGLYARALNEVLRC